MGRWAQRTRAGGGINELNSILLATKSGSFSALLTYAFNIDATQLGLADFESELSSEQPDSINQIDNRSVELNFAGDISGDTQIVYSGATGGILTPQTAFYQ